MWEYIWHISVPTRTTTTLQQHRPLYIYKISCSCSVFLMLLKPELDMIQLLGHHHPGKTSNTMLEHSPSNKDPPPQRQAPGSIKPLSTWASKLPRHASRQICYSNLLKGKKKKSMQLCVHGALWLTDVLFSVYSHFTRGVLQSLHLLCSMDKVMLNVLNWGRIPGAALTIKAVE